MANFQFFKIRSWHIYSGITSRGGQLKARCGRWGLPTAELVDDIPGGEKTCETCAVFTIKDVDPA